MKNNNGVEIENEEYRFLSQGALEPFQQPMWDRVSSYLTESEKKHFAFFAVEKNCKDVDNWTQEQYEAMHSIIRKFIQVILDGK